MDVFHYISREMWFIAAIVVFAAVFPTGLAHKFFQYGAKKGGVFGKKLAEKMANRRL